MAAIVFELIREFNFKYLALCNQMILFYLQSTSHKESVGIIFILVLRSSQQYILWVTKVHCSVL